MEISRIDRTSALEVPLADALPGIDFAHPPQHIPDLQAFLDAMPIAAGQIEHREEGIALIARNRAFARVFADGELGLTSLSAVIGRRVAAASGVTSFAWDEPGIGGRHFRVNLAPMTAGESGHARTMVALIDCTAAIETERSLRFEMLHDSLTGLPNRSAFTEALDEAIETGEHGGGFAVIALNLTRFSRVNESIGSIAGDELIITVARRLVSVIEAPDMIARITGDEFGILVRLIDGPGDALHVARRLREALSQPLHLSDLEIRIDCAVGLAVWHEQAPTSHDIVRNAQFALKRSKTSGRIEIYEAGEMGRAQRRFALETDLRRAIERDELDLAFQPLVDLDLNTVSGFEALARWTHPDRGVIPPIEFITVAEEAGLIVPLGRWVVDRATTTLRDWDAAAARQLPLYISVNVSPVQLARDSVGAMVEETLTAHGIGGERLTFELTESSIVTDPDRAGRVLNALKSLSCRVAMDDFGTGFSSLASLQRLPIDILKIDRQFVSGMMEDRDSTAIIRAILSLATALTMTTIAEGIESQQAARTLGALGCKTGQGYYFAKPMPSDAALAYFLGNTVPVV